MFQICEQACKRAKLSDQEYQPSSEIEEEEEWYFSGIILRNRLLVAGRAT